MGSLDTSKFSLYFLHDDHLITKLGSFGLGLFLLLSSITGATDAKIQDKIHSHMPVSTNEPSIANKVSYQEV